jgi:hypothetical protein
MWPPMRFVLPVSQALRVAVPAGSWPGRARSLPRVATVLGRLGHALGRVCRHTQEHMLLLKPVCDIANVAHRG